MFKHSFKDSYGITHNEAVVAIEYASRSNNSSDDFKLNPLGEYVESSSEHSSINYGVVYWHSQEAKDDGAIPLKFTEIVDGVESQYFHAEIDSSTDSTESTLIEIAENHFKVNTLGLSEL